MALACPVKRLRSVRLVLCHKAFAGKWRQNLLPFEHLLCLPAALAILVLLFMSLAVLPIYALTTAVGSHSAESGMIYVCQAVFNAAWG
jgi:hypothetical protein